MLKVFTAHDTFVENYETNDFTKWYEEKTNIHVEWEAVPSSAAKEKLQVKLATADLPDIFMNTGLTESQMVMFGAQGVFVPLNGLTAKYAPNVKNMPFLCIKATLPSMPALPPTGSRLQDRTPILKP